MENEDVVWENKTLYLINKLENVQIGAARIVTWGTRLVFIMKRQVGRRNRQDGNITKEYIYKMVNGLVPPYLSAMVPCNFKNIYDYNTRQVISIPPVRTRTTLHNN
jgi:hypothetical protein